VLELKFRRYRCPKAFLVDEVRGMEALPWSLGLDLLDSLRLGYATWRVGCVAIFGTSLLGVLPGV